MSKYLNLPDIDTAPDVFETIDEPEPTLRPSNEGGDENDIAPTSAKSELIDSSSLPARRGVEKAFGRTRRKDGSYQLGLPTLSRSPSSSSSEGASSSRRPRDAPAARIRRLRAELEEVEKELAQPIASTSKMADSEPAEGGSSRPAHPKRKSVLPPRKAVDLAGELSGLRRRLEVLNQEEVAEGSGHISNMGGVEQSLRRFAMGNGSNGEEEPNTQSPQVNGGEGGGAERATASDLDRRLASLETLIGSTGEGLDQSPTSPLLPSVTRLDHLLTLLSQPRHLDLISRRLKLLLVDLDRAAASSRRNPSSYNQPPTAPASALTVSAAEYTQLQSLFALLPRLDPLLPILPPLMARLRSLAGLHAEAGRVIEGLKKLEDDGSKRGEEVNELKAVVDAVREGVEEGGKKALGNWEAVEKRMKDLEGRIAKLNEG